MAKTDLYRNLNRRDGVFYSVRQGGRVQGHTRRVAGWRCTFKHASDKQLQAVRTGPRQVCQWVKAESVTPPDSVVVENLEAAHPVADSVTFDWDGESVSFFRVAANPKTADGFRVGGRRLQGAQIVVLCGSGMWAAGSLQLDD